jgi:hypothetical protein
MKPVTSDPDPSAAPAEADNLARLDRAIERLDAITFLGPNDPPPRFRRVAWHPDPMVRLERAIDRLDAIKF